MKQCLITTGSNGLEFVSSIIAGSKINLALKSQVSLIGEVNSLELCRHLVANLLHWFKRRKPREEGAK